MKLQVNVTHVRVLSVLLLVSVTAHAVKPAESATATDVVRRFYDYCVLYRKHPDQFAVAMERAGVRLSPDESAPFMFGQPGVAWRMRGKDYIFTMGPPPYSPCHMHVLFQPKGDIAKAFNSAAAKLPQDATMREIPYVLPRMIGFIWNEKESGSEPARSTALSLSPPPQSKQAPHASLWPDATYWLLDARRDLDEEERIKGTYVYPVAPPEPPRQQ
ncbi:NMCC_0638 family (lipo)protein [Lysobacter sp. CA199]|uniref:NMCC_0638 family (lipo)protein n=1 Tax=Lysobacter sp. CA199 TaxID=3455608 RepID=UPI003F8D5D33